MLKIFGFICVTLGAGGFAYAAATIGGSAGHLLAPEWFYSSY